MRHKFKHLIAASIMVTSSAVVHAKLQIGSAAPGLKFSRWVKGKPIKALDARKIYVVEFWAPWCKYCCDNMPLTTQLATKYTGKVTFLGMAVRPKGENYPQQVTDFVKQWNSSMGYSVAVDDAAGTTYKTWMKTTNQRGIPTAFIVKNGRVAWIGHPVDLGAQLERAVP